MRVVEIRQLGCLCPVSRDRVELAFNTSPKSGRYLILSYETELRRISVIHGPGFVVYHQRLISQRNVWSLSVSYYLTRVQYSVRRHANNMGLD